MGRKVGSLLGAVLVAGCCTLTSFAVPLDEAIKDTGQTEQVQVVQEQGAETDKNQERHQKENDFMAGLSEAADLSLQVDGVAETTAGIKLFASFVVQVLSYGVVALLSARVILDLAYIGLPFARGILSNGHAGNAQAGAGGLPNQSMGMGMGMRSPGMGMGMGMGMPQSNMGQGGMPSGGIQWVSNAALNAVAGETTVGPDGKAVSPFKLYTKDMVVLLVIVPILLTLTVTGTLTDLGFLIANLLIDTIRGIGDMI